VQERAVVGGALNNWKIEPALLAGNNIVVKPATQSPLPLANRSSNPAAYPANGLGRRTPAAGSSTFPHAEHAPSPPC
jgi:hypothetical protein